MEVGRVTLAAYRSIAVAGSESFAAVRVCVVFPKVKRTRVVSPGAGLRFLPTTLNIRPSEPRPALW